MIKLKEIEFDENSKTVKAQWVDETIVAYEEQIENEDGTFSIVEKEQIVETPVKTHFYAASQMDMLREDLSEDLKTYEDQIIKIEEEQK